jgi:hypothetical protein
MKDRFSTEMENMEQRYKARVKELEDQIKNMSGRSELSNSEWLDKLKKKEEEFQMMLQEKNRQHSN